MLELTQKICDDNDCKLVLIEHGYHSRHYENVGWVKSGLARDLEHYGKSVVAFEVTSPKEAETRWYSDILNYFKLFGSDCNLTNIMPSQVMLIDPLRSGERPANILFDRFPELTSVKDK